MVLPATPGGSPAGREWQVNFPLTRDSDLPYCLSGARQFRHGARRAIPGLLLLRDFVVRLIKLRKPRSDGSLVTEHRQ